MHTAGDELRLFHWLQLDQSLTENAREMEVVEGELEAMEVHCCGAHMHANVIYKLGSVCFVSFLLIRCKQLF